MEDPDENGITMEPQDILSGIEPIDNASVAPSITVSSIALNLAMKYHDINTVQDGSLYQQYKLEGKNMSNLSMDAVFETAMRIEAWFLSSESRFAKMLQHEIAEQLVGSVMNLLEHMGEIAEDETDDDVEQDPAP